MDGQDKETQSRRENAYTYIVECADGTWYTGWTNRLMERIRKHNSGKGAKYTHPRRPVRLIYAERHDTKQEAMRREYAIKQLTREEKGRLAGVAARPDKETVKRMGKLYYLMGKSASGKDMIYERLREIPSLQLKPLVIYTTRPRREGETDGVEYHFTDEAHLKRLQEEGRIIELRQYHTTQGIWSYFTAKDESLDLESGDYLGIGTLESYRALRDYFGKETVVPLYIEVSDGLRLERALKREKKQKEPDYEELCRRFLADQEDFSEEILKSLQIGRRFNNDGDREECIDEIAAYILSGT